MNSKIKTFNTNNNTAKHAAVVDGYFKLYSTQEEAEAVIGAAVQFDIGSSPFGSAAYIPPMYSADGGVNITDFQGIDLEGYVAASWRKTYDGPEDKLANRAPGQAAARLNHKRAEDLLSKMGGCDFWG